MALQADYKVRIARNKQGKNGEVIRIKFAKGMVPNKLFDRCFIGVKDGYMYFKLFRGLSNVTAEFDDYKMFSIIYFGDMPGVTIMSKRFVEHFAGYEGEYDKVEWVSGFDYKNATKNEATMFRLYPGARHNYTNLYKNTSTVVSQREESPTIAIATQHILTDDGMLKPLEAKDIATNSIYGTTQAKPADSMTPKELEKLREWHDENTQEKRSYVGKKELSLGEGLNAMFDIMALRKAYTSLYLKVYYKALEKRDTVNVKYFSEKILGCMEFDDYKLFVHDVELALQSVIGFGERDYAELILGSIPELYELTRDYN